MALAVSTFAMSNRREASYAATLLATEGGTPLATDSGPRRAPRATHPPPTLVGGRYQPVRRIGAGAFGTVYEAIDQKLSKPVAVKLLHSALAAAPEAQRRFRIEARAASQITHPHIVSVTDFDVLDDGRPYLVMEYVHGTTLEEYLRDNAPLHPMRAARLAHTIASALAAAHTRNVIHRDLKPANIMVGSEDGSHVSLKILDFGVAKLVEDRRDVSTTHAGALLGTPAYMAPEQIRTLLGPVDGRSDVYSLGIVLYEMLTGTVPFRSTSLGDLLLEQVLEPPDPPGKRRPGIPKELEQITLRALAKKPSGRFADAAELARALDAAMHRGDAPLARRRAGRTAAAAAVIAAAAALLIWGPWRDTAVAGHALAPVPDASTSAAESLPAKPPSAPAAEVPTRPATDATTAGDIDSSQPARAAEVRVAAARTPTDERRANKKHRTNSKRRAKRRDDRVALPDDPLPLRGAR